jgi:hypothetical protein
VHDFYPAAEGGPSSRWGHTLCMLSETDAVLIGGQGDRHVLCKDAIWRLDMSMQDVLILCIIR